LTISITINLVFYTKIPIGSEIFYSLSSPYSLLWKKVFEMCQASLYFRYIDNYLYMKNPQWLTTWSPLTARILIGGLFLMSAVGKAMAFEGTVGFTASVGLPIATLLVILSIILEILGGLSIILGYKIRYGAAALIIFVITVSLSFHTNFTDQIQMTFFMKF